MSMETPQSGIHPESSEPKIFPQSTDIPKKTPKEKMVSITSKSLDQLRQSFNSLIASEEVSATLKDVLTSTEKLCSRLMDKTFIDPGELQEMKELEKTLKSMKKSDPKSKEIIKTAQKALNEVKASHEALPKDDLGKRISRKRDKTESGGRAEGVFDRSRFAAPPYSQVDTRAQIPELEISEGSSDILEQLLAEVQVASPDEMTTICEDAKQLVEEKIRQIQEGIVSYDEERENLKKLIHIFELTGTNDALNVSEKVKGAMEWLPLCDTFYNIVENLTNTASGTLPQLNENIDQMKVGGEPDVGAYESVLTDMHRLSNLMQTVRRDGDDFVRHALFPKFQVYVTLLQESFEEFRSETSKYFEAEIAEAGHSHDNVRLEALQQKCEDGKEKIQQASYWLREAAKETSPVPHPTLHPSQLDNAVRSRFSLAYLGEKLGRWVMGGLMPKENLPSIAWEDMEKSRLGLFKAVDTVDDLLYTLEQLTIKAIVQTLEPQGSNEPSIKSGTPVTKAGKARANAIAKEKALRERLEEKQDVRYISLLNFLLTGMQLTDQMIKSYGQIESWQRTVESNPQLTNESTLNERLSYYDARLSSEQKEEIEKEVGFIGTLLSDKYGILHDKVSKGEGFGRLVQRYPETDSLLSEAVAIFKAEKPSTADVARFNDFCKLHLMERAVGSPQEKAFDSIHDMWNKLYPQEPVLHEAVLLHPVNASTVASQVCIAEPIAESAKVELNLPTTPISEIAVRTFLSLASMSLPEDEITINAEIKKAVEAERNYEEGKRSFSVLKTFMASPGHLLQAESWEDVGNSDKILLHVVLEHAGEGTGLEGFNTAKMQSYILAMVVDDMNAIRSNPLCHESDLRDYCSTSLNLAKEDVSLRDMEQVTANLESSLLISQAMHSTTIERFNTIFVDNVKNLKAGESFLFMSVWKLEHLGHAVAYEVIKQTNGQYAFRIYNRGDGSQHHDARVEKTHISRLPFAEVFDVPFDRITDPVFTSGLQELETIPKNYQIPWTSEDFYVRLIGFLEGKQSRQLYTPDHGMREIYLGICTLTSQTAYLSTRAKDVRSFDRQFITWKMKTLKDYHLQKKGKLFENEQSRRLIRMSVIQISRDLSNARELRLFTDEEMTFLSDHLKGIEADVERAEAIYLSRIKMDAVTVKIKESPPLTIPGIELPQAPNITSGEKDLPTAQELHPLPKSFQKVETGNWEYEPVKIVKDIETLIADLDQVFEKYPALYTNSYSGDSNTPEYPYIFEPIKRNLEAIINAIPLKGSEPFWKNMTPEEAENALKLIGKLSLGHLKTITRLINGSYESDLHFNKLLVLMAPSDYLIAVKLLTIGDMLAKDFQQAWGFSFPHLYQSAMDWVLFDKFMDIEVDDPKWKEQRHELKNYWTEVKSSENYKENDFTFFHFKNLGEHRIYPLIPDDQEEKKEAKEYDLQFAKRWAMRPEIASKMPPEIASQPLRIQALYLLANREDVKDIALPSQFFELRKLSLMPFYLMTGWSLGHEDTSFPTTVSLNTSEEGWKLGTIIEAGFVVNRREYMFGRHEEYGYQLNPLQRSLERKSNIIEYRRIYDIYRNLGKDVTSQRGYFGGSRDAEESRRLDPANRLLVEKTILKNEVARYIYPGEYYGDYKPYDVVENPLEVASPLDSEMTQRVLSLRGVAEVQIHETLGFFSENPQLLKDEKYRYLLKVLLNEDSLFMTEAKKNTRESATLITDLAAFLKEQMNLGMHLREFDIILDLVEINQKLSIQLDYVMEHKPGSPIEGFTNPFADSRSFVKHMIASNQLSDSQKGNANLLLYHIHEKMTQIDEELAIDILRTDFHFDFYGMTSEFRHYQDYEGLDYYYTRARAVVMLQGAFMEEGFRNRVLNSVMTTFITGFADTEWKESPTFPYYTSSDGKYFVDIKRGKLNMGDETLRQFTFQGRDDPLVKNVLGDTPGLFASRDKTGTIRFNDLEGNECIYYDDSNLGKTLLRNTGGRWHQAFEASFLLSNVATPNLFKNSFIWIERPELGKGLKPIDHFEFTVQGVENDPYSYKIEVETEGTTGKLRVTGIYPVNTAGNLTGEVLGDIYTPHSCYNFLSRLEDMKQVRLWENKESHEPTRLELPRYQLKFTFKKTNGEFVAVSDRYPGYHIAKTQYVPFLGDYPNYLLLQNDKGQQKLILPAVTMQPLTAPLETGAKIDFQSMHDAKSLRYTTHTLSKDGTIIPDNTEGRFHLASTLLWERRYPQAMQMLRGDESQLRAFTEDEKNQLSKMLFLSYLNKDQTPEVIAIHMYIHYLLKKDKTDFGAPKDARSPESLLDIVLIDKYAKIMDQIGLLDLKPRELEFLGIKVKNVPIRALSSEVKVKSDTYHSSDIVHDFSDINSGYFRELEIKIWTEKLAGWLKSQHLSEAGQSVMNAPIGRNFWEIAKVLLNGVYELEASQLYEKITGIELEKSDHPEAVKQAFQDLFRLNANHKSKEQSECALILEAMIYNSESFKVPDEDRYGRKESILNLVDNFIHNMETEKSELILSAIWRKAQPLILAKLLEPAKETPPKKSTAISRENVFPLNPEIHVIPPITVGHQKSVSLQASGKLEFTGVEDVSRYFTWVASTEGKAEGREQLSELFSLTTTDPVFNGILRETGKDVDRVAEERALTKGRFEPVSGERLLELQALLQERLKTYSENAALTKSGVMALANKPFDDPRLQEDRLNLIRGGYEKEFSIEELLQLFHTLDMEAVAKRNPSLTPSEIEILFHQIKKLIEETKAAQHQKRMLDDIAEIESHPERDELQSIYDRLALSMQASTQYQTEERAERLPLEMTSNIIMRKDQVTIDDKLSRTEARVDSPLRNGVAVESKTGSGKSTTIQQMLNRRDANGKNLVITVMPDPLLGSLAPVAQAVQSKAYGSKIEPMHFDINTKIDVETLRRKLDLFKSYIDNREIIYTTDSSAKSLYLKHNQFDLQADINDPNNAVIVDLLTEIWALFRSAAVVTIDEVDQILAPLKSNHFTFSDPTPLHPQKLESSVALFSYLFTNEEILREVKLPFNQGSDAPPYTEDRYEDAIKPRLIEGFLNGKMFENDPELLQFVKSLSESEKDHLRNYLASKKSPDVVAFVNGIDSKKVQNILATLKQQINYILPLTLGKNLGEHFGPRPVDLNGPEESKFLSIPYKGSNNPAVNRDLRTGTPMSHSEHGTDLEVVDYTTIMHLLNKLPEEIVTKEIDQQIARAKKEAATRRCDITVTKGYAKVKQLCGNGKDYNLLDLSPEDRNEIADGINQSYQSKMELIQKHILSGVKTYRQELSCGGQIYAFLFNLVKAYSGTLWNSQSYPMMFNDIIKSDAMANTINTLWENSPKPVRSFAFPKGKLSSEAQLDSLVASLYPEGAGFKGGFMDAAGYFRDYEDNKLVAKAILKHSPPQFTGIDYFGPNGEVLFLERGSDEGIPIELCTVPLKARTAYFDQIHTTGADLKLGAAMTGTVSIGRHNIMRDLIQSAGRFRGLDKGQRVDFVVSEDDMKVIREELKKLTDKEVGDTLTLGDLIIYTLHIESLKRGEDNIRAIHREFEGVFREIHMEVRADPTVSARDKIRLTGALETVIIDTKPSEPIDEYGSILIPKSREDVVKEAIDNWLNGPAMQAIETFPGLEGRYSREMVEKRLKRIAEAKLPHLPLMFIPRIEYGNELVREVATETSTQMNIETQTMTDKSVETNIARDFQEQIYTEPRTPIEWNAERLFDWNTYQPADLQTIKESNYAALQLNNVPNLVSVGELLADDVVTKKYGTFLTSNVMASLNLMPVYRPESPQQLIYHPYGKYHDYDVWGVFIQNVTTGEYKMVLCNQKDAAEIRTLLENDRNNPLQANNNTRVFLYNFKKSKGIVDQGSNRVDQNQVVHDPKFTELVVQGKYLIGALKYTPEERVALKQLINENNPTEREQMFHQVIIGNQALYRQMYEDSDIANVFAGIQ